MRKKIITSLILAGVMFCSYPAYASENVPDAENPEKGAADINADTEYGMDMGSIGETINAGGDSVTADSAQMYIDSFANSGSLSLNDLKQGAQQMNIRDVLNNGDYTAIYGDVMKSIEENNPMKLSMAIGSQMKIPVPENIAAEVAIMDYSSVYDVGLLNLQYMALSQTYTDSFVKAESSQQSINCMELFNATYGDLASSLKLEEPKIPDGFDPNKMVSDMSKKMGDTYLKSTTKGSFGDIKNSISIGNIFSTAQKGMSGAYDRGVPSISFSDVPATPLSGAYSSLASGAGESGFNTARGEMAGKFGGFAGDASSAANDSYRDNQKIFNQRKAENEDLVGRVAEKVGGVLTGILNKIKGALGM